MSIHRQSVSEADIDWLFCVELNTSPTFRSWVADRLFQEFGEVKHIDAWRSVSSQNGESDLLWLVHASERPIMGLIENKITAGSQPNQYGRYVLRGEEYLAKGECQDYRIALLSPKEYRTAESEAYPIRIFYEDIRDWLKKRSDTRSQYLADIYGLAINRKNQKNLAPEDEDMKEFHRRIWNLAKVDFPELEVPNPDHSNKSAGQTWLYIYHPGYTLIYKMYKTNGIYTNCVVDLELAKRGDDVDQLKNRYAKELEGTQITMEKTSKSACFRLHVSLIAPPKYDEAAVREALEAASKLKSWWEQSRQSCDTIRRK